MEVQREYSIKIPEKVNVKSGEMTTVLEFKNMKSIDEVKAYIEMCNLMNMVEVLRPMGENILV